MKTFKHIEPSKPWPRPSKKECGNCKHETDNECTCMPPTVIMELVEGWPEIGDKWEPRTMWPYVNKARAPCGQWEYDCD